MKSRATLALTIALFAACAKQELPAPPTERPSILLVTLDTTRFDAIGNATPSFNALAAKGRAFRQAYATAPQTLPSHTSMFTGLYPAAHRLHENGRSLPVQQQLVTERLREAGYRTGAFVSAFALARRFGLARGFDLYDDEFPSPREERTASETTERAIAWLNQPSKQPSFLWVHYYDPHFPYSPPPPQASNYPGKAYLGEVAYMDEQLGRLIERFEQSTPGPRAIVVVSDHGEGLGDHGEKEHGDLLYQPTMHVPLVIAGPGVTAGTSDEPVSTRRVAHTILDWAGIDSTGSLRRPLREVVVGEAMKPFLSYGWQPQVMAVDGARKAIVAGRLEVYDVVVDPGETNDLGAESELTRGMRAALRDYPIVPPDTTQADEALDDESRKKLASLGYVASTVRPRVRADAPRPAGMTHLFPVLDQAAVRFVAGDYAGSIPLLRRILADDPNNLEAALRLATAYSSLGRNDEALAAFRQAEAIGPDSRDVRTYLALHYARGKEWQKAVPLLERIRAEDPKRLPPLEALAVIRERQDRVAEAIGLRKEIYAMRPATSPELRQLGTMQMALGQTADAIATFELLRSRDSAAFANQLELGVLYLAAGRLEEARAALDRVAASHRDYPLALFKRAQVSVLLKEDDAPSRIEMARRFATPLTRELIARERLFQNPQN
ncbi:MAG: sulfatase-like hydrolase/transferase [Thermoanaerobaculia bacterium]|nr:sulfatase-like hydrolase/transferase [Thermoanaerobaculia bacterium]